MPKGKSTVPAFDTSKWKGILEDWKKEKADTNKDHKIIIVGAGAAGLYAAYTLQCLGFENYEILEASGTIGGRLSENTDFIDLPLDEGAEWIHFSPPQILEDLLLLEDNKDFDVETFPYTPQTWGCYSNGKNHKRHWLKHMHKIYVEHKFTSTTWYSYLEKYILAKIPKEKLRLNTPVKTIDWTDPDHVNITTVNGDVLIGAHVIVAVSVGVLQQEVISFVPPMPSAWTDELNKIEFAPGYKAWFQMKEKFYSDVQLYGRVTGLVNPTSELTYFDGVFGKPTEANVLATLQMGQKAVERSKMSDEELQKFLLKEIDEMYEGKGSENLIQSAVKNWSAEPYIRGTYSVSIWHDKELLRKGVPGRVLFAGEHLGKPQIAVQGALLSGRFAVEALLESTSAQKPANDSTWSRVVSSVGAAFSRRS